MKKIILVSLLTFILSPVASYAKNGVDLKFNAKKFVKQQLTYNGKSFFVRAYEDIVYVGNPIDTAHQKMNIYIPEEYFEGKTKNGYNSNNAPIFFPNKVGGYMPAFAATTKDKPMDMHPPINGEMPMMNRDNMGGIAEKNKNLEIRMPPMNGQNPLKPLTIIAALSNGYVVASAGARGRITKDENDIFIGKAPAGLVDLKAAIRYLKFNDNRMPGDANKIISNGTSAGGAMSTLLGATGNHPNYEPYLKELGAADTSDNIFAVSAYCPITNLEHADMTYEWQFYGINTYKRGGPMAGNNPQPLALSEDQIEVSDQLKKEFLTYLNSLHLKDEEGHILKLDHKGEGNFKELVQAYVIASAQAALNKGVDLSSFNFLTIRNNKVEKIDFQKYLNYIGRQKTPPAFDALDASSPENNLFGTSRIAAQHFTEFGQKNSTVAATLADRAIINMMNPMNYIGQKEANISKYWRIRHGSKDKDTSLAISIMLATALKNNDYEVDLAFPWEKTHSGDYDLDELFQWIDRISK